MGFSDNLRQFGAFGPFNQDDPLFGGLIPRRYQEDTPNMIMPRQVKEAQPSVVVSKPGLANSSVGSIGGNNMTMPNGNPLHPENPFEHRDLAYDRGQQELDIKGRALDIKNKEMQQTENRENRNYDLASKKFQHDEDIDYDKQDIEHRKQALEEWKTRNPEGKIEIGSDGQIYLVDPRNGKTTDTGIKSEHLSDEQKIKLQLQNKKEELKIQNDNNLARDTARHTQRVEEIDRRGSNKVSGYISPSQQRVAEADAALEYLNKPENKDLEKYITYDKDKGLSYTYPEAGHMFGPDNNTVVNLKNKIDKAVSEIKKLSNERMNRTRVPGDNPKPEVKQESNNSDMVDMVDKNNTPLRVPKSEVDTARSLGARLPNEPPPMPDVHDDIELLFNDKHEIVGARNKLRKPGSKSTSIIGSNPELKKD